MQKVFYGFGNKIFSIWKQTKGKIIKILTPKKILQRLPIPLAQVKAGGIFEKLVNGIFQTDKKT